MSGIAQFEPYTAKGSRLALAPIRFAAGRDGATQVSTVAQLDGPFPDGRVRALRVPISGRLGSGGSFAVGTACAEISFAYLQTGSLQLGPTRLPVCPIGPAIISKPAGGDVRIGARISGTVLNGRLGQSPMRLAADSGRIIGKNFNFNGLAMRLGRPESPIVFDAAKLSGNVLGQGLSGTFAGGSATIGNIVLQMNDIGGRWRFYNGDLTVNGALTVDRTAKPRFYPLRSDNMSFSIGDDMVRAGGTLKHPASGTQVTDVAIEHALDIGRPRDARRSGDHLRPGAPARGADPPDRRRDRAGQRNSARAGPDRLGRRQGHARAEISRPTTWISPRRSGRSRACGARSISPICWA